MAGAKVAMTVIAAILRMYNLLIRIRIGKFVGIFYYEISTSHKCV